ncbi:hypothetical protein C0J52_14528 [Blattella germanica]|nr:hypothetical protein C0J52_14528 [Blattella germanica]
MSAKRRSLLIRDYCCICNKNYGLFIDIFRKFENRKYHLEIEEYLNLKVSRRDGSSKLCHRCLCNIKLCKELQDQFKVSRHVENLNSCYLCKNRKVELFDVLPHAEREKCLIHKLKQCFSYQAAATNGSPLKLCISCTNKLDIFSEMMELVRIRKRMKEEGNSVSLNNSFEVHPSFDSRPSENLTSKMQIAKHENPFRVEDFTKMKTCTVMLLDIKQRRGKRENIDNPKMNASRSVQISPRKSRTKKVESFKVIIKSESSKNSRSLNKKKGQKINTELRTAKSKSGKQNKSINTTQKPTAKTTAKRNKTVMQTPSKFKFFCSVCSFRTSKKVPMKMHELSHEEKVPILIIDRCDVTFTKAIAKEHLSIEDVESAATSEVNYIDSSVDDEKILEDPLKDESADKHSEEVSLKQCLNEATETHNNFSEEHQEDANVADVLDKTCTNENTIDNKVGDKSQTVCQGDTFEHEIACKVGVEGSALLISDNSCAITEESVGDKEVEDSASAEEVHEVSGVEDSASPEEVHEVSGISLDIIEESEGNPLVNDDANTEQLHEVSNNEQAHVEESEVINNADTEEIHEPIDNGSSISQESEESQEEEITANNQTNEDPIEMLSTEEKKEQPETDNDFKD